MENTGQRIRRLRKALEMSQATLAEKLGVDQSTVSDIERGAGFSAELLMKLADALETSPAIVMRGQDDVAWPFKYVPMENWLALDPDQRTRVEGRIEQLLEDVSPMPSDEAAKVLRRSERESQARVKPIAKRRSA